jgi:ribosomal protein S18 acetylase RimI-like enzyme
MNQNTELITADAGNVEQFGFFCYKSKPKSDGYQNKLNWLRERFSEGMVIKIVYENERSVGFIEYIPAEYAWRAVEAPGYLVIHCLWVVGRGKGKGYGSMLLSECVEDARRMGKHGVVMLSSTGNWLANEKVFVKNGFEKIGVAAPSFNLLVKRFGNGPDPAFPQDWDKRLSAFGSGMTVVYTDQCPYIPDAVRHAREAFEQRGIKTNAVKFESCEELRATSPSPYGIFSIVYNGKLFSYHYLGTREIRRLNELLGTEKMED